MDRDPKAILAESPMGAVQIIAVAMCVLLNALDGFDVLSISFAAPGIASEWGIDRAALGLVLSMELIGMAVGSVTIGYLADHYGRRPIILACLLLMASGMYLASTANSVPVLSVYRFLTGIGIGGMLAATNAMVAEYSNARYRSLAVTIMAAGYPAGAILGGAIASQLLKMNDWRIVFEFGAVATAVFIPLVWFLLPESIEFLTQKRPPGALERVNRTLRRMGHETVSAFSALAGTPAKAGPARLFAPDLRRVTVLLTAAYFLHIMTFYFTLKWIPKIVVHMGFAASAAGGVLVWANVGGLVGSLLLGLLSRKFEIRALVIGALFAGAIAVVIFGLGQADLKQLSIAAAGAGFFTNAAVVGLYALFAQSFPTEVRAGGTGFVIGIGRGGAALGPIVAGLLFVAGAGLPMVATAMAAGSLVAAIALLMLRAGPRQVEAASTR
jgi:benzoate transport